MITCALGWLAVPAEARPAWGGTGHALQGFLLGDLGGGLFYDD